MMRTRIIACGLTAALACGGALLGCDRTGGFDVTTASFKDRQTGIIPQAELPEGVAQTFHRQFPKGRITQVEERQYPFNGSRFYRVHFALENMPGAEQVMDYDAPPGITGEMDK